MPYNPFDPPIGSKLTSSDLDELVSAKVAEGQFVEYKRELPDSRKLGRGVASFANSEGGWYIVGVLTDGKHEASEICGIDKEIDVVAKVREVVKTHIEPSPVTHPQVVELSNGRIALVVRIPTGSDPPYVTRDGRIYRRTGDSTHPIVESRRHDIDRLIERRRESRARFAEFCEDDREFSQAEEEQAWLQLYVVPEPSSAIMIDDFDSRNSIESLLERSRTPTTLAVGEGKTVLSGNVPFNAAWPTGSSVVLRQVTPGKEAFNSLELELLADGRCKTLVPITAVQAKRPIEDHFQSGKAAKLVFSPHLEYQDRKFLRFADLAQLWLAVSCLLTYYLEWLKESGDVPDLHVVVRVSNAWRTVGFLDIDEWADEVRERGLPMIRTDSITLPRDFRRGALIRAETSMPWLVICAWIGQLFGLTRELLLQVLPTAIQRALDTSRRA